MTTSTAESANFPDSGKPNGNNPQGNNPDEKNKSLPERTAHVRSLIGTARSRLGDTVFYTLCFASALSILFIIVGLLWELTESSWLSISKFGFGFITSSKWDPVAENFGAAPFIYGTVISSLLALLIALPLSLGVAVFLVEVARNRTRLLLSIFIETLAAIPSIVYGLWGFIIMVPKLQELVGGYLERTYGDMYGTLDVPYFYGPSILASSLVLAIMIIPIITAISRDVMLAIPTAQREAALALGSTKWEAIKVVLANARWGILGGIILGLGRALGETMAVTMVIGNNPQITSNILKPAYSMASVIANELNEATTPMHNSALIEIGLVLLLTTFIVNMLARLLVWSVTRSQIAGARQ
jgi:phosphate transport system permease protein